MKFSGKVILTSSVILSLLVIAVSLTGLLYPGFYAQETANWQAQTYGQDLIDLVLVVPTLLIAAALLFRGNKNALLVWGGAIIYLLYTFVIYCFSVHFNRLFLLYCFTLGLSFYSFLYEVVFGYYNGVVKNEVKFQGLHIQSQNSGNN